MNSTNPPLHSHPKLSPSLFSVPLGILALSGCWERLAHHTNGAFHLTANYLLVCGVSLFAVLLFFFLVNLIRLPAEIWHNFLRPDQTALFALIPVTCLLAIILLLPYFPQSRLLLSSVMIFALCVQGIIAWRIVTLLSTGQIEPESISPSLYLPIVPGGFIGAMALNLFELPGFAMLLLGMGLGGWALLEIRILHRLFAGPLPMHLRPSIGIEIAPAAVGSLAVLSLWPNLSGTFIMIGVGIASGPIFAILTRWRWWTSAPFSIGFWSFCFPLAALASTIIEAVQREHWPIEVAYVAVMLITLLAGFLLVRTIGDFVGFAFTKIIKK